MVTSVSLGQQIHQTIDLAAEILEWDELIHTSYFRVASFRALIVFSALRGVDDISMHAKFLEEARDLSLEKTVEEVRPK